jgi:DNA-binding CsgD family transcriptional regulator
MTLLSDSQVIEIYEMLKCGISGASLAKEYGVCETVISHIRLGKTRKRLGLKPLHSMAFGRASSGDPLRARILDKTSLNNVSGCWEWLGTIKRGYGMLSVKSITKYSHRVSYEAFIGPIPSGMCVCHKCDNPGCCNPDHLFLGTVLDNMTDMVSKSRSAIGSRSSNAKISEQTAMKVMSLLYDGRTSVDVARILNLTKHTVRHIKHGRAWSHITGVPKRVQASSKIRDTVDSCQAPHQQL